MRRKILLRRWSQLILRCQYSREPTANCAAAALTRHQLRLHLPACVAETRSVSSCRKVDYLLQALYLDLHYHCMRLCVTSNLKHGPHAQLVAMAKRSKALEDRLRESEAREKRAREDAQVKGFFNSAPGQHPAVILLALSLLISRYVTLLRLCPKGTQVRQLCPRLWCGA